MFNIGKSSNKIYKWENFHSYFEITRGNYNVFFTVYRFYIINYIYYIGI